MEELEVVCPKCKAILRTANIPMVLQDSQIHPDSNVEEHTFECPGCNEKLVMIITVTSAKSYYQA